MGPRGSLWRRIFFSEPLVCATVPNISISQPAVNMQPRRPFCEAPRFIAPVVEYQQVVDALSSPSVLVVDVREPAELVNDGVIPGAVNIPLGQVQAALDMSPAQFTSLYCQPA